MSTRNRRTKQETCNEILDAAERMIARRDYHGMTVSDIAADLGMSPANIFKNFGSKFGLVDAMIGRRLSQVIGQTAEIHSDISAFNQLRGLIVNIVHQHLDHFDSAPLPVSFLTETFLSGFSSLRQFEISIRRKIEEIIRLGIDQGEFVDNDLAQSTRNIFLSLSPFLDPVMLLRLRALNPNEDLKAEAAEMVEFAIAALRKPLEK